MLRFRIFSSLIFTIISMPSTATLAEPLACFTNPPSADELTAWRSEAAVGLASRSLSDSAVSAKIAQCFSTQVPSCLQKIQEYVTRFDVASEAVDITHDQDPRKQPPAELLAPGSSREYVIRPDIEQLAAQRGWPAVRYKSRHAGGFDGMTPSLLMVYIPGDRVSPPVSYDRWLNFPLPADAPEHALTPLPQVQMPTASDYAAEPADPATPSTLPTTFTLVTVEKKQGTQPGQVFFQMFHRGARQNPNFTPQSNTAVASCYTCHPNGLRAISPLGYHVREGEAQLPERDWNVVRLMNRAMDAAGGNAMVSWRDGLDATSGVRKLFLKPKASAPVIGPVVPLNSTGRTEEFIMGQLQQDGSRVGGCYRTRSTVAVFDIFGRPPGANNTYTLSNPPNIRWEKVRDSMRCATCHNNTMRAALNDRTSYSQIDFKILVDQSMPLGAHKNPLDQGPNPNASVIDDLTGDERIALTNCLRAEFTLEQTNLDKALTQGSCQ